MRVSCTSAAGSFAAQPMHTVAFVFTLTVATPVGASAVLVALVVALAGALVVALTLLSELNPVH